MALNVNVNESMSMMMEKLENFLTSKTVVGEPLKIGDTTLIPFVSVSFGMGSGGGDGTDPKGAAGVGGGAGMGARVSPTAVLVMKEDSVELLPIKKTNGLDKLLEMVPDIVTKMNCCKEEKPEEKE